MDWSVIFFFIILVIGLALYGWLSPVLGVGYIIIGFVNQITDAITGKVNKAGDALVALIPQDRRKIVFNIFWIVEVVVILLAFLLSKAPTELMYSVLSSTPAGGLLNFFHNPNDFFIGKTMSAWMVSGIAFIILSLYANEIKAFEKRTVMVFLHTFVFTFFIGIIISGFMDLTVVRYLGFLDTTYENGTWSTKLLVLLAKGVNLLVCAFFILISVKVMIDNLKTMAMVFIVGLVFVAVPWIISLFVRNGVISSISERLNYLFFEMPTENSLLSQFITTVIFNGLYVVAQFLIDPSVFMKEEDAEAYRADQEFRSKEYREEKRRKEITSDYKFAAAMETRSKLSNIISKRSSPEDYEKYEKIIDKYGSMEQLKQLAQQATVEQAEADRRMKDYREKKDKAQWEKKIHKKTAEMSEEEAEQYRAAKEQKRIDDELFQKEYYELKRCDQVRLDHMYAEEFVKRKGVLKFVHDQRNPEEVERYEDIMRRYGSYEELLRQYEDSNRIRNAINQARHERFERRRQEKKAAKEKKKREKEANRVK